MSGLRWIPRHGQWVLFANGHPWTHRTKAGLCVGIFQKDSPIINPSTGLPYVKDGLPVFEPRHIVPVDENGRNYRCDRTNYKTKGAVLLHPAHGFLRVDDPADLDRLDKHFADNRMSELPVVVRLEDAGGFGPLIDPADMPPGRAVKPGWKPKV